MSQTFGWPCRSYQPPSAWGCREPFSHFVWSLLSARSVDVTERARVGLELGDVAATGRWNQCWHSRFCISHCFKKNRKKRLGGSGRESRLEAKGPHVGCQRPTVRRYSVSLRFMLWGIILHKKICGLTQISQLSIVILCRLLRLSQHSWQMSHNFCLTHKSDCFQSTMGRL